MCLGAPRITQPARPTQLPMLPPPPPAPAASYIQPADASSVGQPDPNNPQSTVSANRVGRNSLRIPLINPPTT